jgi:lysophospholipase L1-like esterase
LIGEGEIILAGSVLGNSVNTIVKKGKITLQNTHATVGWKIGFTRVIDPGSVDIKHDYVDYQEVDDSEPYPLTFTAGATVKDLSFYSCPNNSDTWSALSAGVTVSGDLATFNFSAQPTNSWLAAFDEAPEVGSYYSCGAGPGGFLNMQAIFVKTENSYRAVVQDASNDMGINQVEKVTSVSNVTTAVTPLSTADMPAFYLRNSTLAIYITKYNEYIIAQNGVTIVGPIRTPNGEAITAVGWGFYNQAFTFTCGLLHPTKTRRPRPPAPRPMKIVCFGDSLTDPAVPGWPEHMTAALQGSNGSQVEQVINTAISGNTSTQQLTALTALDKTGVTLAVGMIGVNDAQQGFNSSSFKANILAIADLFKAVGAPVVFVTAHAYYSQVQAAVFGGKGGVTLNQESGSVYRESMKWAAAQAIIANSVPSKVIDITSVVPPALTKYLDWSSSVHYGARAEPVVYDNVHFHMKARTYLGRAAAIGALGLLCPKARRGVEPLPVLSTWMRNSWTQASNWQSFWWIDAQGVKHLKCFLIGGSTIADGTIAIQLPTMLRPANPNINPRGGSILDGAYSPGSPNASLQMAIDGSLKVFAVDASTKFFSFEIAYV